MDQSSPIGTARPAESFAAPTPQLISISPDGASAQPWTTREIWILAAVVAVYIAARLYRNAAVCLDGDEIFSVGIARQGWSTLTAQAGADSIHPPLFYYLLKLWIYLGNDSLFWLRLLPSVFSVLAIVPTVLLARDLRLRPAEINGALGLAAIHPFLIYYSQHVRMYTLLMLCALTSLWLFHRTIAGGKRSALARYLPLTLANIVLVNSHYYGWLVVGLECVYIVLWKREQWKQAALSAAVTLAGFTPWLVVAGKYAYAKGGLASNLEWIQKPGLGDLIWFFVDLAGFTDFPELGPRAIAALTLLFFITAWFAWKNRRSLDSRQFAHVTGYLAYFLFGSVAIAFLASRVTPSSVWGHRHMIYLALPFLLMVACAYCRTPARAVRVSGAVLCAVWACLVIRHQLNGDDKKTPFDTLVLQMLEQEKTTSGPVTFFAVDKYLHYPIWFFLESLKDHRKTGFAAPIRNEDLGALAVEAARIEVKANAAVSDAQGAHFWVGYTSAWNQKTLPEQVIVQRGCRVGPGLRVRDRYHTSTIFPVWCGS